MNMSMFIYICVYIRIYIRTYIRIYIFILIYIHAHIYIYVLYIYMYIFRNNYAALEAEKRLLNSRKNLKNFQDLNDDDKGM
jgi:hypothetical protein